MTTIYYSIIEKETGRMEFGRSNYIEHTERPLHESLAYVPLNNELYRLLVSTNVEDHTDLRAVDFTKTHWDFKTNSWVIVYQEIAHPAVDPLEEALKQQQELVRLANIKLSIPDVSSKYKEKLEKFISDVNSIKITKDNVLESAQELLSLTIPE